MGNWQHWAGWSPQGRRSGGVDVSIYGLDLVNAELAKVTKDLRPLANSELRHATKDLARSMLVPGLYRSAVAAPNAPLATAIWGTHIVRSDRIVNVQLGRKKPGISGFQGRAKKGQAVAKRRQWTQVTWGSEMGPAGGSKIMRTTRGGARPGANYYGVNRKTTGHWVQPAVDPYKPLARNIRREYEKLLVKLFRKWQ